MEAGSPSLQADALPAELPGNTACVYLLGAFSQCIHHVSSLWPQHKETGVIFQIMGISPGETDTLRSPSCRLSWPYSVPFLRSSLHRAALPLCLCYLTVCLSHWAVSSESRATLALVLTMVRLEGSPRRVQWMFSEWNELMTKWAKHDEAVYWLLVMFLSSFYLNFVTLRTDLTLTIETSTDYQDGITGTRFTSLPETVF